jgi:acyl-CoA synthetase (AMP-forming)/AMP-acid ligase II
MITLRQRLVRRPGTDILIRRAGTGFSVAEALAEGPRGLRPADRVLLSLQDPEELARMLVALDGEVEALLLASYSFFPDVVEALARTAGISRIITDRADLAHLAPLAPTDARGPRAADAAGGGAADGASGVDADGAGVVTQWLMTTSGTTGIPKIVTHSIASLTRSVRDTRPDALPVWGLLYDMTRFAGMQVGLQAMTGHGTLAAIDRDAPLGAQVEEMVASSVTHLSATPTLWRRLLMAPGIERLALSQVTLGGEIADQAVLDAICARFPAARLTHIYASTEVGVGFAVTDGRAGFPAAYLSDDAPAGLAMRVDEGMLWLRPPAGQQSRYLGDVQLETDAAGYVRSGDLVELRPSPEGDRVHFLGRDSGVVNVGGVKVYPERVEALLNAQDGVSLSQVMAKSSPITGNLLVATVVPTDPAVDRVGLKRALMEAAQAGLEREAVPAIWRFVDRLDTNAAGKIIRQKT